MMQGTEENSVCAVRVGVPHNVSFTQNQSVSIPIMTGKIPAVDSLWTFIGVEDKGPVARERNTVKKKRANGTYYSFVLWFMPRLADIIYTCRYIPMHPGASLFLG